MVLRFCVATPTVVKAQGMSLDGWWLDARFAFLRGTTDHKGPLMTAPT